MESEQLKYYGFRFYDPNLQRWLNRDPIQEWGGINLYVFVDNTPARKIDPFGEWDENRPPISITCNGTAQYGPPADEYGIHDHLGAPPPPGFGLMLGLGAGALVPGVDEAAIALSLRGAYIASRYPEAVTAGTLFAAQEISGGDGGPPNAPENKFEGIAQGLDFGKTVAIALAQAQSESSPPNPTPPNNNSTETNNSAPSCNCK
jgi:hypothetical protein